MYCCGIEQASRACGSNGVARWERVKALSVVVQLDSLSLSIAERCMEGLELCSGPLEECVAEELLDEAVRFAGFLLSRDVKAFLAFISSDIGPVSLAYFPVEGLVSTFVKLHSRFHRLPVGLPVESQPILVSQVSGASLEVLAPVVVLDPFQTSDPAPAPISSVSAPVEGNLERTSLGDSFLSDGPSPVQARPWWRFSSSFSVSVHVGAFRRLWLSVVGLRGCGFVLVLFWSGADLIPLLLVTRLLSVRAVVVFDFLGRPALPAVRWSPSGSFCVWLWVVVSATAAGCRWLFVFGAFPPVGGFVGWFACPTSFFAPSLFSSAFPLPLPLL
ncbi:hypothetical protein KI387_033778 [Taxus chinensis]|uniref:Uncharacterized protein n=1 Tax=Taxus chinensis TaxID=29808 RepID=A0AA38F581_TAXCH|nr:hypothetical protein KI387_033778 [Taxus chinensis]